jgi:hypothetical protein
MTAAVIVLCLLVFLGTVIWGADRALILKQVEIDLKEYLGDVLVARDASDCPQRVHFDAQVFALKTLIRKHFTL